MANDVERVTNPEVDRGSSPPGCRSRFPRQSAFIRVFAVAGLTLAVLSSPAATQPRKLDAESRERLAETYILPIRREFQVGKQTREALIFAPKSAANSPAPVVFAFHGHGGTMQKSVEMFGVHSAWKEAIVVYPQGLPTAAPSDPAGRRPGWNTAEAQGNRDVLFFDAMLAGLEEELPIDRRRIFACGNSNGGFFTYTLWALRPDVLAAVAPAAATLDRSRDNLQPKPVFCIGGEQDDKVPLASQRKTFEQLANINGCAGPTRKGRHPLVTIHPSPSGMTLVTFIHPGGHAFPREAVKPMVEFFKRTEQSDGPE